MYTYTRIIKIQIYKKEKVRKQVIAQAWLMGDTMEC